MSRNKTILLVEDNPSVLHLMERALSPEGHTILTASSGEAALRAAGEAQRIDLLVTDLVLPRMNGVELAARIAERDPSTGTILISGYTEAGAMVPSASAGRTAFLRKPFSAASFRSLVREILSGPGPESPWPA